MAYINQIFKFFDNNPWFNIVSLSIGLFGILFSYYFYFKSLKVKKPLFNSRMVPLISIYPNKTFENKMEIRYNGNPVRSVSLTTFVFWNAGKLSIRKEDLAPKNPLTILMPSDVNIFDYEIIDQDLKNNFVIEQIDSQTLKITFDFLDYNDGIIFNIFHNPLENKKMTISGTIIDSKPISKLLPASPLYTKSEKLFIPVNSIKDYKYLFLKVIGFIIIFPITIIVMMPLALFIYPVDYVWKKINRNFASKYLLEK